MHVTCPAHFIIFKGFVTEAWKLLLAQKLSLKPSSFLRVLFFPVVLRSRNLRFEGGECD